MKLRPTAFQKHVARIDAQCDLEIAKQIRAQDRFKLRCAFKPQKLVWMALVFGAVAILGQ